MIPGRNVPIIQRNTTNYISPKMPIYRQPIAGQQPRVVAKMAPINKIPGSPKERKIINVPTTNNNVNPYLYKVGENKNFPQARVNTFTNSSQKKN